MYFVLIPHNAIVTRSVVAFVTREGKKKLETWEELANPEIKVITANPKTKQFIWHYEI